VRAVLVVLTLVLAAACDIPHPFEHGGQRAAYPLAALTVDVWVGGIDGLPAPMGTDLTRSLTEALGAHGVTALQQAGAQSRFVLRGEAEPPAAPDAPYLVTWTLYDDEGIEAGLHVQEVETPPPGQAAWPPEEARRLGETAAKAIAGLIGIDAELPEGAAATVRSGLFVGGVTGAPGNGNGALFDAIGRALANAGLPLAETAETAEHLLDCRVSVGPPDGGSQPVEIRWQVRRPDGGIAGEATQNNAVPAGSLDGRWGPVAGYIASAAVDGIQDILRRQRNRENNPGFDVPEAPDLPAPPEREPPAGNAAP